MRADEAVISLGGIRRYPGRNTPYLVESRGEARGGRRRRKLERGEERVERRRERRRE